MSVDEHEIDLYIYTHLQIVKSLEEQQSFCDSSESSTGSSGHSWCAVGSHSQTLIWSSCSGLHHCRDMARTSCSYCTGRLSYVVLEVGM